MAENMGGRSWNRGAICHRSKVICTSGLMAAILNFGSRTTSGNVGGDIGKSGMVDNVGVAVGIAAPSLAVQTLFPLPVFAGRHLGLWWSIIVYQRRSTSGSVPSVKSKSGVVGNVGVAFEIVSLASAVQKLLPVPVWWPPS